MLPSARNVPPCVSPAANKLPVSSLLFTEQLEFPGVPAGG